MKGNLFILVITIVTTLTACNAQKSETGKDALATFISSKADSLYTTTKIPGIFIGVVKNGQRQYFTAGYGNPDTKAVFDSATLFEIGSITKTFTAYVLGAVLREKNISDTSFIISWLPDSVKTNKALGKISFLSLMNHTSGLPRLPANMNLEAKPLQPYEDYTSDHLFSFLKIYKPAPGGKMSYSNLGAGIAGVMAERISGKTYAALLDEYIFLPFKMASPDKNISRTENKSQGYFGNSKTDYWNMNVMAPAGGLKCSGDEMLTYLQSMMHPVNDGAQQLISKLLEKTADAAPEVNVCRGWFSIEKKDKPLIYWHNGGTYGFSTFAAFCKEKNSAVIVVVNQFNKNGISDALGKEIMWKLAEN